MSKRSKSKKKNVAIFLNLKKKTFTYLQIIMD